MEYTISHFSTDPFDEMFSERSSSPDYEELYPDEDDDECLYDVMDDEDEE